VLDDNARVDAAVTALKRHDWVAVAALVNAAHASLRDLYEISVPPVEETVARLVGVGAAGARLIGGGFGGSVLGLFPPGIQPPPDAVIVAPAPGATVEVLTNFMGRSKRPA
jgi:galactokinase